MKNTRTTLKERLIPIIALAVLAASITGCKDKNEAAQEKSERLNKEYIDNMNYKAPEPKKSTF